MPDAHLSALVVTSAHWYGDPRLNRHVDHLSEAGIESRVISFANRGRLGAVWAALSAISRLRPPVVILPDPELHLLGSLLARLTRTKPVIDIHEDYAKSAAAREWIPRPLRPLVAVVVLGWERAARIAAAAVVVAAPELARQGDHLVANIPGPDAFALPPSPLDPHLVVYLGDVTRARGAMEMVEALGLLGARYRLLVLGRADGSIHSAMKARARVLGLEDRLELTGRLSHDEAWARASGAVAGLCLLQPAPAYRMAVATKIWEYMAVGIPPVVSDLAGQASVVGAIEPDLVCASPEEAATVIRRLSSDEDFRRRCVDIGRKVVKDRWEESRPDLAIQRAVAP